MPYYCTVPRCTSMAGKAKNVSFHQFPRDEELAKLWNDILKRGKPYTKYSKVCSLHFKPEDYTITSVGKNKGQWRTLRKDAIPSQNLPSETPAPYVRRERNTGSWVPSSPPPGFIDPRMQQQMAQAIYVQTMLAMHAAGATEALAVNPVNGLPIMKKEIDNTPHPTIEQLLRTQNSSPKTETTSYKCTECLKCFKDPDVFILHKRSHTKEDSSGSEKENTEEHMLKANPILANLLKVNTTEGNINNINSFDTNNIVSIENHIMAALAVNMESYIRNLSSMLGNRDENVDESTDEEVDRGIEGGMNEGDMGINEVDRDIEGGRGMNEGDMGINEVDRDIEGGRGMNEGDMGINEVDRDIEGGRGMNEGDMGVNEVDRGIEGGRGMNEGDSLVNGGDSGTNGDDRFLNEDRDINEGIKAMNEDNKCLNEVNRSIIETEKSVNEPERGINGEMSINESADSNNLVIDENV